MICMGLSESVVDSWRSLLFNAVKTPIHRHKTERQASSSSLQHIQRLTAEFICFSQYI